MEEQTRRLAREIAWLRGLLLEVASGLDRLAAEDPSRRARLGAGAAWIRRQLHRGPPEGPAEGVGVGNGPRRPPHRTGIDRGE